MDGLGVSERIALLKKHLTGRPYSADLDFARLGQLTEGLSEDGIKDLCDLAASFPMAEALSSEKKREITSEDFENALKKKAGVPAAPQQPQETGSTTSMQGDSKFYLSQGEAVFLRKDFLRTIELMNKCLEANPKCTAAYLYRGRAKYDLYDMMGSIDDLKRGLEFDPKNYSLNFYAGFVLKEVGFYKESIDYLTKSIEYIPAGKTNSRPYMKRGIAYFYLGDYEKALTDLDYSIRVRPSSDSLYARAKIFALQGRRAEAERDFQRAFILRGQEAVAVGSGLKKPSSDAESKFSVNVNRDIKQTLSDVMGVNDEVKRSINKEILYPFRFPEEAKKFGKTFGGGILLYGPPGCGKTYLAYALAGELKVPLIDASVSSMRGKFHGDTIIMISSIFKKAKEVAPCIVLIDEIDAVGGSRELTGPNLWMTEYIDQLLQEINNLGGTKVLIIGATNVPWGVDPAIRRSGRFDTHILIGAPDQNARRQLLHYYLAKGSSSGCEGMNLDSIAQMLEGYSASDVRAICEDVSENLMEEYIEKKTERKPCEQDFIELKKSRRSSLMPWYLVAAREINRSGEGGLFTDLAEEIEKFSKIKGFDSELNQSLYR
ncbi:MAG: AAA family ATPase [Candidatus Altiarchaeota archaeon]